MKRGAFLSLLSIFCLLLGAAVTAPAAGVTTSAGAPVARATVSASGSVSAVYGIRIVSPGTNSTIQNISFGKTQQEGEYYSYVDLVNEQNSSAPLLVKYSVAWKAQPASSNASLEVLDGGQWVDLNNSGMILKPGESTASVVHEEYPSPVRATLSLGSTGNATYNLTFIVYGTVAPVFTSDAGPAQDGLTGPNQSTSSSAGTDLPSPASSGTQSGFPIVLPSLLEILLFLGAVASILLIALRVRGRKRKKVRVGVQGPLE